MPTNPVVKLKKGAWTNLTPSNYPLVDGQLFFASGLNAINYSLPNVDNVNQDYNIIAFDTDNNGTVSRKYLDAIRSVYAYTAAFSDKTFALNETIKIRISGVNSYSELDVGSQVTLSLPSTITATLVGRATSATKLVDSNNANIGVGSNVLPVYFSAGVPVACAATGTGHPLTVDISGNASTANSAESINTNNSTIGSTSRPVYFSSAGYPTAVSTIDASLIQGTISSDCIPAEAKERMIVVGTTASMTALTSSSIQEGDIVRNGEDKLLYYVVGKTTFANNTAGVITGTNFQFVEFAAGTAANAVDAQNATQLSPGSRINNTLFDGSEDITTSYWGTTRAITLGDVTTSYSNTTHTGTAVNVNGSGDVTLLLPTTINANITGTAANATTATKLGHGVILKVVDFKGDDVTTVTYGKTASNSDLNFSVEANDLFPIFTVEVNSALAVGNWLTITNPSSMTDGTYIIQIYAKNASSGTAKFKNEYFSGVMSYSSKQCAASQTDSDEVLLHACGKGLSGHHIYFRTRRTSNSSEPFVIMEMSSDVALVKDADQFTIKFRRII